jgi:hypothetical protein
MMRTLSTMVVVGVVRMNLGSEMVVEREGGQKGNAEGWKAISISSLAHQSISKINKKCNEHVYHSSPSEVMRLCARLSTLLQFSLQPTKDDRTSNRPSQVA